MRTMRGIVSSAAFLLSVSLAAPFYGQSTQEESQAAAHALAKRQRIVTEFGSPAQRAAYESTPGGSKPAKLPKLPHNLKNLGPGDLPAINDYLASRQQPSEVYDTVFASLTYPELYRAPLLESNRYAHKTRAIARAEATALWKLYSLVPSQAGLMLERSAAGVGNRAEARIEEHEEELVSLARMQESEKLLAMMLPAEEADEFRQGTYRLRAAKVFKAAGLALDKSELPNPYVLQLCDPNPRMDSYRAGTRARMAQLAPQNPGFIEANWRALSEPAKWRTVTEAQREFLRAGETYFTTAPQEEPAGGPADANTFFEQLPPPGAYSNAAILMMMGPHGAAAWKQASPSERQRMERTAAATNAAFEILLNTLIVQVREAELATPDPDMPITNSPSP